MTATSTPLVSIVLPTYNGSRFIVESITSCLRQTYSKFELIIVDGGSTDNTLEVVSRFDDPRIKVIHQPDNIGRLPGALNVGFAQATGDYLTWTQDDDYFTDNALQELVDALEAHPTAGLVYAGYWWIDEQGKITRTFDAGSPDSVFWTNPVGHCFLYRRQVAERVGGYDVDFYMAEDFHYWLRLYRQTTIVPLPGHYFYHRWQSQSLTVKGYGRFWALRVGARARRQILKLNWLEYLLQISATYIEETFAAYQENDWAHVRSCLWRGLVRNPSWLLNRGVLSIIWQSVFGSTLAKRLRSTDSSQAKS